MPDLLRLRAQGIHAGAVVPLRLSLLLGVGLTRPSAGADMPVGDLPCSILFEAAAAAAGSWWAVNC